MTRDGCLRVPLLLGAAVSVLGGLVGAFFGLLSGFLHMDESGNEITCGLLGAACGVGAGLVWCLAMRRLPSHSGGLRIVLAGTFIGGAAGLAAAIILHGGLALVSERKLNAEHLAILGLCGAAFGVPAGLGTGLVCGLIAWAVASHVRREPPAVGATEKR